MTRGKVVRFRDALSCLALGGLLVGCPPPTPAGPGPSLVADPAASDGTLPGAEVGDFDRGVEFIKRGAFEQAIVHFDRVLAADPRHAQAEYYRALAREQLGQREAAIEGYRRALELDPSLVDAAVNLGAIYLVDDPEGGARAQPREAIAVLEKAVAKVDDDPGVHENLAYAYRLTKDYDQALAHYQKALSLADEPRTRFALGDLLVEAKRCDDAVEHLTKAAAGSGDDFRMLVTIADLLGQCQAFGPCVKVWDAAIELQPGDAEWYVRRGLCHHGLDDEAKARKDFQAAIDQDSSFAAAHYYLGMSWRSAKKTFNATRAFQQAVELDPNGPIGKRARQALQELKQKR